MGNNKWALLFFIVLMVWQAVAAIMQSNAKKKKQQQLGLGRGAPPSSGPPARPTATAGPTRSGGSRLESLEARRRAQLEELRARRQKRQGGAAPGTSMRMGRGTVGGPLTPTPVSPVARQPVSRQKKAIRTLEVGRWQEQQDAEKRRQEALRRQQQEQQQLLARRETALQEARLRRQQQDRAIAKQRRGTEAEWGESADRGARPVTLDIVRQRLAARQSLAELFVLKEILDPPVAMRDREIGAGL